METRDQVSEAWAEASTPLKFSPCSSVEEWEEWAGWEEWAEWEEWAGVVEGTKASRTDSDDVYVIIHIMIT
jgi:hypothetical protein